MRIAVPAVRRGQAADSARPRPGGFSGGGGGYSGGGGGGFGGPRPGGFSGGGGYAGGGGAGAPGGARQKDFGPPAPPKDKKKPFKKKDDKPRGPIPTKFTGRTFGLDDLEDDDAIDITPDFMKHEDPEVDDADDGRRTETPDATDSVTRLTKATTKSELHETRRRHPLQRRCARR